MGERLKDRLARERPPAQGNTTDQMVGVLSRLLGGATRFELARTTWPGCDDVKIGLRLLSDWEVQQADSRARAWAREQKIDDGRGRMDEREFTARYAVECLAMSLCDPDKDPPTALVSCADELSKAATREELGRLATAMADHQEALAPFPEQLTDEELERLADALKKAPRTAATVLRTCAPSTLRRLCSYQADQLGKLTRSLSSPSKPHGGDEPANSQTQD